MTIIDPISQDDSYNVRIPASTFRVSDIPINADSYSDDFLNETVFLFDKKHFKNLALGIINTGENSVDYTVLGKIDDPDVTIAIDETWKAIPTDTDPIASKGSDIIFVGAAYSWILIRFKETVSGSDSVIDLHLRAIN